LLRDCSRRGVKEPLPRGRAMKQDAALACVGRLDPRLLVKNRAARRR